MLKKWIEKIKSRPKKKHEWSKILCGTTASLLGIYGIWCGYRYYQLCEIAIVNNSIMPDATLAVTCVTMILGAVLSYLLYQLGLKTSRNKYGIDADGQPFKTIPTQEEIDAENNPPTELNEEPKG